MWRLPILCLTALAAAFALNSCGGDDSDTAGATATGALPDSSGLLFVLRGPAEFEDGRLSIEEADTVDWFTDRPRRRAGTAPAAELAKRWADYGFAAAPPNAALSGDEVDAEVEISSPRADGGALSFDVKKLQGDLPPGDLGEVSVFIDSTSAWATSMHVYAFGQICAGSTTLQNPVVVKAPDTWGLHPVESVVIPEENDEGPELFTAASKGGSTSFEVRYDIACQYGADGVVSLTGSVPDSIFEANKFKCAIVSGGYTGWRCEGSWDTGFHVWGDAWLIDE
jgi:hypothetical protein